MNDQVASAIRTLLKMAGAAFIVKRGWLGSDQLDIVIGAVMVLGGAGWSYWHHQQSSSAGPETDAKPPMKGTGTLLVIAAAVGLAAGLLGCASASTNIWRSEQTAVNLVSGAYAGWTNYYVVTTNAATTSAQRKAQLDQAETQLKAARMHFAASVGVVEAWRSAYETNSAVEGQLQAALQAALDESSNIVWVINYWRQ